MIPLLAEPKYCTGCTACAAVCPKHCIRMQPKNGGFLYPVVDAAACIHCGLCTRTCPVLHPLPAANALPLAYAAMAGDDALRMQSTSGGVFPLLAQWVLNRGGTVFGAAYQADFSVAHCAVTNPADLQKLQSAKYTQSILGDSFQQILQLLTDGNYVLFSGTPCQVSGLRAYLKKPWERLILVDLICHGVPSPDVWQAYRQYRVQNDAPGSAIRSINLRSKETGWPEYSIRFEYENGQIYHAPNHADPFLRGFVRNLYLRDSCASCPCKGLSRISDITLADYWGVWDQLPQFHDQKGTSLVLIHSEKGLQIFNALQEQLRCQAVDPMQAIAGNPAAVQPSVPAPGCAAFWQNYRSEDFSDLICRLLPPPAAPSRPSLLRRGLRRIKQIFSDS